MKYFFVFIIFLNLLALNAQTTISGVVLSSKGEAVFAVNISTDRQEGTATDFDGKYSLNVAPGNFILK